MNRNILITGASGEIGRAIALRFAKDRDRLFLHGFRNKDALFTLKKEIEALGASCEAGLFDLSAFSGCASLLASAEAFFGTPDILINNAGISHVELFQDSSDENFRAILDANLSSAVRLTKECVRKMLPRHSGRILNISSVFGQVGASMEVEYALTKGGIDAFTRALAKELAPSGITVNAIAPGAIDTKMNGHLSADERAALCDEIPIGRLGRPDEVAELCFLLAAAPEYLTGQVIRMDGGWV